MTTEHTTKLASQIGDINLFIEGNKLLSLTIEAKKAGLNNNNIDLSQFENPAQRILLQLQHYFTSATSFTEITLAPQGSRFQKLVWNELTKIPVGETRTYGQIAHLLNTSARAVGNACRKNPIAIIIPCHRVLAAKGIGGYAGKTTGKQIQIKRWLLNHEGVRI